MACSNWLSEIDGKEINSGALEKSVTKLSNEIFPDAKTKRQTLLRVHWSGENLLLEPFLQNIGLDPATRRASNLMDEIWEKAVESALDGQTDHSSVQTLTLDGAVKCVHGRLPPPAIFEKFDHLHHLSIANTGVSSLEHFPTLKNLQKLNLSDNRIAGGLNHLVEAGLESLRDLDLSNNRIQFIDDLAPLAQLRLLSLDLYESPVTRVKDYRARVFGLIKSLRFLDKMDVEGNERPESDDEDDDDEDEEDDDEGEEEDEEDPGSGEIDGDGADRVDRSSEIVNGGHVVADHDDVVDEDEESDADEEESEIVRNGSVVPDLHQSNGFHVQAVNHDAGEEEDEGDDDEDGEYEEDNDSGEEIDEDGVDADVVEVHEILDSDDEEEDGVDEEDDDDDEDSDEEVDNEEVNMAAPYANGRLANAEGVIDGHEHGEDDEEDGEEEEEGVEDERDFDDDEEEEDGGAGYLVQPVIQAVGDATASDMDPSNDDEDDPEDEEIQDDDHHGRVELQEPSSSSHLKRKRDVDSDCDDDDSNDDDSDDDDDDGDDDDGEDDTL